MVRAGSSGRGAAAGAAARGVARGAHTSHAPHGASNLEKDSWQVPESYLKKYYPAGDPKNNQTKYAAMVSAMDEAIGEVFATLRELRLDRTTLVLFFADNGRGGSQIDGTRLRGSKGTGFEGGLRSPLIAWWPGTVKPQEGESTHEPRERPAYAH